ANQPQTGTTTDGGYAEVAYARASGLVRIPDGAEPLDVAPLLCAPAPYAAASPERPSKTRTTCNWPSNTASAAATRQCRCSKHPKPTSACSPATPASASSSTPAGDRGCRNALFDRHQLIGGIMTSASTASPTRRAPELLGQTVVVVGGSAGIGLETARRARAEGADVILTGRNPDRLQQAARELDARSALAFDATDFARLEQFFADLPTPIDHVL